MKINLIKKKKIKWNNEENEIFHQISNRENSPLSKKLKNKATDNSEFKLKNKKENDDSL